MTISNISSKSLLASSDKISYRVSMGGGEKICSNQPCHMTNMATRYIYKVNTFKHFLLWNQWTDGLETWYVAVGTQELPSLF